MKHWIRILHYKYILKKLKTEFYLRLRLGNALNLTPETMKLLRSTEKNDNQR